MNGNKIDRRRLLKQLGISTVAIGGLAGSAKATDGIAAAADLPAFDTNQLSRDQARRSLRAAAGERPGDEMGRFLRERRYRIDRRALTGQRVRGEQIPEHVVLDAPIQARGRGRRGRRTRRGGEPAGLLQARIYEDDTTPEGVGRAVTVQAVVDGTAYMATPLTVGEVDGTHAAVTTAERAGPGASEDAVVRVTDWQHRVASQPRVASADWPWNCMVSGTYGADGAVCMILGGLTGIAGAVLMLVPEPGSTIVGTVALGTALSGSCTLAEGLEAALDLDCDVNSIGLCVTWPGFFSPPDIYIFPAGDCYAY